ncbi:MAG: cell division protein SepF, partial [Lachnospiraceae bacterium]|nr:cell division protein SepF [Lachnospiraceae bacterium]
MGVMDKFLNYMKLNDEEDDDYLDDEEEETPAPRRSSRAKSTDASDEEVTEKASRKAFQPKVTPIHQFS